MTDPLKIKVILGTTRPSRFSEMPGRWILGALKRLEGVEAELLDLRDYPMPFFNEAVSPSMKQEPYAHPAVAAWTAKIAEADGFVMIAAEYNHGYPAVLKNAIDYVGAEWHDKAVSFVSYGSGLGARSVEQLREVAVELQMAPLRFAVQLPWDVVAAARQGKPEGELFAPYEDRAKGMLAQLVDWSRALKSMRQAK